MPGCSVVRGIVVVDDNSTPVPLPHATVQLGRVRRGNLTFVAETRTNADGKFFFELQEIDKAPLKNPVFYKIRVLTKDGQVRPAHGDVMWRADVEPGPLVICVDPIEKCADLSELPAVTILDTDSHGLVRHHDGTPVNGLIVEARSADIADVDDDILNDGQDDISGNTINQSGVDGFFQLDMSGIANGTPFILKVFESGTPNRLLATSEMMVKTAGVPLPRVDIDICDDAYRRLNEFIRIQNAVNPIRGSILPRNFTLKQIAILSGRTDWDVERLTLWSIAHRIEHRITTAISGLSSPPTVDVQAMYGLLRMGYPTAYRQFISRPVQGVTALLQRAAARNIIAVSKSTSPILDDQIEAIEEALKAEMADTSQDDTLGGLLAQSTNPVLTAGQIKAFVKTYVDFYEGNTALNGSTPWPEEFWTTIAGLTGYQFTEPAPSPVEEAKRMVTLSMVALSYAPLVAEIIDVGGGDLGDDPAADVVGISDATWVTIVDNLAALPEGLLDDTATTGEKKTELIRLIKENVALLFPAEKAGAELAASASDADLQAFLNNGANDTFNIATSRVDAFTGDDDEIAAAKKAQRLYRISPALNRTTSIDELMSAGISSAHQIARMGRTPFLDKMASSGLTLDEKVEIYTKAKELEAKTLSAYFAGSGSTALVPFTFLPTDPSFDLGTVLNATEATAYGSGSGYCDCRHCRSVLSPAAYLVDLLRWLDDRDLYDDGVSSGFAQERRADIGAIKLSCENTLRPMPYIDLVLETMEVAVHDIANLSGTPGDAISGAAAYDTTASTSALLANPQNRQDGAYTALQSAAGNFSLPFHRSLTEMENFLGVFGVPRYELQEVFGAAAGSAPLSVARLETSAAYLTSVTDTVAAENSYWPVDNTTALESVDAFMKATDLSWPDVLDLLHTQYLTTAKATYSAAGFQVTATDWCDLSTYTFVDEQSTPAAPDAEAWTDIRQFLRLQRITGWSTLTQDKALKALGVTSLNGSTWTTQVANIQHLHRLTGLSVLSLATVFATDMDTHADRATKDTPELSLFDQLFLSPSHLTDQDAAYTVFVEARDGLAGTPPAIGTYASEVAQGLSVSTEELDQLAIAAGFVSSGAPDLDNTDLTLTNLTTLYKWRVLSQATGRSAEDVYALARMVFGTASPFPTDAAALIGFVEISRGLEGTGWGIDALRHLLLNQQQDRVGLSDSYLQTLLGEHRTQLRGLFESGDEGMDEAGVLDAIAQFLAEKFGVSKETIDAFRAVSWAADCFVENDTTYTHALAEDATFTPTSSTSSLAIRENVRANIVTTGGVTLTGITGSLPAGTSLTILAASSDVTLPTNPVTVLKDGEWTRDTAGAANNATIDLDNTTLTGVTLLTLDAGTQIQLDNGDIGTVVASFNVGVNETVQFSDGSSEAIAGTIAVPSDPLYPLRRMDYSDTADNTGSDPYGDITGASDAQGNDFRLIRTLGKFLSIIDQLSMSQPEIAFWMDGTNRSTWSLLAPSDLDVGIAIDTGLDTRFTALHNLIVLFAQRERIPNEEPTFVELLDSADAASFNTALASRTGWDAEFIGAAHNLTGADYQDSAGLEALMDGIELAQKLGVDPSTAAGWTVATGSITAAMSAAVVNAARARYDSDDAWSTVAKRFRDPMRKAQRDALVAYLLDQNSAFAEADDIYQHYLIDVSMNPEMMTSRIKQAAASVQLFIHRIMMGLELNGTTPIYVPTADDREQWEWMRNYRVWEAARKVFLYPENWTEPELRDDKTPQYLQLEQALAQGDVTDDRVEEVTLDYLEALHTISNLQVLAYYQQTERFTDAVADDIDRLHVFARTRSEPPTYWYRRLEDGQRWTPWEEINAGVQGDNLLPVVYNRRLMLFWGEFTEEVEDDESTTWGMTLAWSIFHDGKWSPRSGAEESLSTGQTAAQSYSSSRRFALLAEVSDGDLLIHVNWMNPSSTRGTRLDSYRLNACTMEARLENTPSVDIERLGITGGAKWSAPGFQPSLVAGMIGDLTVYNAPTNEDNEYMYVFPRTEVQLLGEHADTTTVTPGQYEDFVSQADFFVQTRRNCWFVRPGEVDAAPHDRIDLTNPDVGLLPSLRFGTWVEPAALAYTPVAQQEVADTLYRMMSPVLYQNTDQRKSVLTKSDSVLTDVEDGPQYLGATSAPYHFSMFYHPLVCDFVRAVRRGGIFALLDPDEDGPESELRRQQATGTFDFSTEMLPNLFNVDHDYPTEDIDFSVGGAYAQYNWELFFHLPLYVATQLSTNGRHEDAMPWFHAIFDPRAAKDASQASLDSTSRWWKVKPLMEPVSAAVTNWAAFTGATGDDAAKAAFEAQVAAWQKEPFNPHLIARLRPGTYQKVVVMKYLDNLIAWGDQLFTRDTLESLNEATQVYVYALQLIGDRPVELEAPEDVAALAFNDFDPDEMDAFGNVVFENSVIEVTGRGGGGSGTSFCASIATPYFCVPHNARLLSYWDTLEDRLFKLRNGMNIDGVARSLPLFEPPIDPAALVRAAAAGLDISSVVSDQTAALPLYRFQTMHGRAMALAGSVKGLGNAMLSAIERWDGEQLARLRSQHEVSLLQVAEDIRQMQIDEAMKNMAAVKQSKMLTQQRHDYYDELIEDGWLGIEKTAAGLSATATVSAALAGAVFLAASPTHASPPALRIGDAIEAIGKKINTFGSAAAGVGSFLTVFAQYKRRKQEWKQQRKMANKELKQLDLQLEAAQMRIDIAERELSNHRLQVEYSQQVYDWMRSKYSSEELYDWMVSQLSTLYYQTYQLALSVAKKAERCYQHELGRDDSFLQSVYFDSLHKGLLAGDRLMADLERMDIAYLDNNIRERELTKHVSLSRLDGLALEELRQKGECWVTVPEELFDLDCPGHYFRRISSVAVTVACVSGAQRQINMELTLHDSMMRQTPTTGSLSSEGYTDTPSIVTSVAVEDAGVFSANGDGRYMPFERRGAVSVWKMRFCNQVHKQFDWSTISDVVMHLRYTARDGGADFRDTVLSSLDAALSSIGLGYPADGPAPGAMGSTAKASGILMAINAKRDEPDALFQSQENASTSLTLTLGSDRLPYFADAMQTSSAKVQLDAVYVLVDGVPLLTGGSATQIALDGGSGTDLATVTDPWNDTELSLGELTFTSQDWPDSLTITLNDGTSDWSTATDVTVVLQYSLPS